MNIVKRDANARLYSLSRIACIA